MVSTKDVILGLTLENKGSQFFNIYKQKMESIIENYDSRFMYANGNIADESKIPLLMNYVKAGIFEFIKIDITSLNSNNLYLIERVYYPYKSKHTLDSGGDTYLTVMSKTCFLGSFIDNFESLIKGVHNIIVLFVLSKNNVIKDSTQAKAEKEVPNKYQTQINENTIKLQEFGFTKERINFAMNYVTNPLSFDELLEWLLSNPEIMSEKNIEKKEEKLEKEDTEEKNRIKVIAPPDKVDVKTLKEMDNDHYVKCVMDIFKKIGIYYFKNVLHISRVYSSIQSFMSVYTSQSNQDARVAKKFLFVTYYSYLDAFYLVRNYLKKLLNPKSLKEIKDDIITKKISTPNKFKSAKNKKSEKASMIEVIPKEYELSNLASIMDV